MSGVFEPATRITDIRLGLEQNRVAQGTGDSTLVLNQSHIRSSSIKMCTYGVHSSFRSPPFFDLLEHAWASRRERAEREEVVVVAVLVFAGVGIMVRRLDHAFGSVLKKGLGGEAVMYRRRG